MSNSHYQAGLFNNQAFVLNLEGLQAKYWPNFLPTERASELYHALLEATDWRQETITVYGKAHLTPRLSSWVGDAWMSYRYSNHTLKAQPWSPLLLEIKREVEKQAGRTFNSVLLNYYRDGQDSNGWHSDDEPELGIDPIIASLSLGGERDFQLRNKANHSLKHNICLENGSLLLMGRGVQNTWQHQVPKRANALGRINLTFRTMVQPASKLE